MLAAMPVGRLAGIQAVMNLTRGSAMFGDDDLPKPKKLHEIGCDLTFLSAGELEERIALLRDEIARLETDKISKTSSRSVAESLFKSK